MTPLAPFCVAHVPGVLGTDLGQTGNPLEAAGITRDQIQAMGRGIPAALPMG